MSLEKHLNALPRGSIGGSIRSISISLEDLLKRDFGLSSEEARSNLNFIKAAVWKLSLNNPFLEEYKAFFSKVNPALSAKYLIGALKDPSSMVTVVEILKGYGDSDYTVRPLVGALRAADVRVVNAVKTVLSHYGPSIYTVRSLVPAMSDHQCVGVIVEILTGYGASASTVHPLVGALNDPSLRPSATRVLLSYGGEALQFILPPRKGTRLYGPLTGIMRELRGKKPHGEKWLD